METQNAPTPATRLLPSAEKGAELTPAYLFLPFLAGFIAVIPTLFRDPDGIIPRGLFFGGLLFIQAWINSSILDKDKWQRPYYKVFAEAQLMGCISICFMIIAGIAAWHWVSILITAVYALIRLAGTRLNVFAILVHFLAIPLLITAFVMLASVIAYFRF